MAGNDKLFSDLEPGNEGAPNLFGDLTPAPASARDLFAGVPTKAEADKKRAAEALVKYPNMARMSAGGHAKATFDRYGQPYDTGFVGDLERVRDSILNTNAGNIKEGIGGAIRSIGDVFQSNVGDALKSNEDLRDVVTAAPMFNLAPHVDSRTVGDTVADYGHGIADSGAADIAEARRVYNPERPDSVLAHPLQAAEYYSNMAAGSAAPFVLAAAAPEIGLPAMGVQSGGQEYNKRRDEGADIGQALQSGLVHGAAEVIPESRALHVLHGSVGSAVRKALGNRAANFFERNVAGRVAASAAAEGGSEAATQIAQDANDRFAMGDDITTQQMLANAKDASIAGAIMAAPVAGTAGAVDANARKGRLKDIQDYRTQRAAFRAAAAARPVFRGADVAMPQQDTTAPAVQGQPQVTVNGAAVSTSGEGTDLSGLFRDLVPAAKSREGGAQQDPAAQSAEQGQTAPPAQVQQTTQGEPGAGGLFPGPTSQEITRGAERDKDDVRNGKNGRVTPGVGGLPLFAGPAPEQTDIEGGQTQGATDAAPETDAPASREAEVQAMKHSGLPESEHPFAPGNEHLLQLPDGTVGTTEVPEDTKRQWIKTGRKDSMGRDIRVPALDYSRGDGLLEWLAANGGVNFDDMHRQMGTDPALMKSRAVTNPLGKVGMTALRRNGGMSIEQAFERMQEDGWLPPHDPNAPPRIGAQEAEDLIHEALNGRKVYHPSEGADARMADEAREHEHEQAQRAHEDLDQTREEGAHMHAALDEFRRRHAIDIHEGDAQEAADLHDAVLRASNAGVPESALGRSANETRGAHTDRLRTLTEEASHGTDEPAARRDREGGDQGRESGPAIAQADDAAHTERPASEQGERGATDESRAQQVAGRKAREGAPETAAEVSKKPTGDWQTKTAVTGKDGKPLKIHRGSRDGKTDADAFFELGASTGHPSAGLGVWFTSDAADAKSYGTVGDYYLDIRNPKTYHVADFPALDDADEAKALRRKLERKGHDGIVMDARSLGGPVQYVAFRHEQVKTDADLAPQSAPQRTTEDAAQDTSADADAVADTDFYDPAIDGESADEDVDALRRMRKKKDKRTPVARNAMGRTGIAYDMDIYTDNGYSEGEIDNMPPSQQVKVASNIVRQTFGFSSVDVSGNLNTLEAANQLRHAYRNMQSMAAVLGWPSATFGKVAPHLVLGREAQGALAYFSPSEGTVAITRENDAFAHEFGHGIDWWVWQQMGVIDPRTGEPKGRAATGKLKLGGSLRSEDIEGAFSHLLKAMYSAHGDTAFKIAGLEKHILVIQKQIADLEAKAGKSLDDARVQRIQEAIAKRREHIKRIVKQIDSVSKSPGESYQRPTDYYLNARLIDKNYQSIDPVDGGYWQRPTEMFARAFEAYVAQKVEDAGGGMEFLGRTDAGYLQTSVDFIAKAYPQELERQAIFSAIDHLMLTLRDTITRGVEGPTASVRLPNPLSPAAWRMWVPDNVKPVGIIEHIRDTQDEAALIRRQNREEGMPLARSKKDVRDARNPEDKALADIALRFNDIQLNARASWAASITGWLHGMESRYPESATFGQISRIFTTTPGSGRVRHQTYEEYRDSQRKYWGNELGRIIDKHKLKSRKWTPQKHRQLRDAMVDWREGGQRPDYPEDVLRAAKDLRTFHDEMHQFMSDELAKKGHTLGYAKNGYLQRIVDQSAVQGDQSGFLADAASVYGDVFERDIGTVDKHNLTQMVRYAGELSATRNLPETRTLKQLARKLEKAEADGEDTAGIEEQISDLLEGGLYDAIKRGFSEEAAHDYMARILGTVADDDFEVQGAQGSFMKSRELPASADIKLGNYLVNDALSLTATYMTKAVNKAAFERFVPGDGSGARRLSEIRANLAKDGVLEDDIEEAMKIVSLTTGMYRPPSTKKARRVLSNVSAFYTPVLLGRSMMAQLAEPATAVIRTGNVTDGMLLFKDVIDDLAIWLPGTNKLVRGKTKERAARRRELAAFTGAVDSHHFSQIMNSRVGTLWANKKAGQKLAAFFTHTFIHPHAMAMRRASVEVSTRYFKRIAAKALGGDALARRDLADVGIDYANDGKLVEYLANDMPDLPMASELAASPYAQQLSVAINRFVDETVIEPKIVDKPRNASTAETSFMYSILSFQSGFTNNVLLRATKRINTTFEKDGLTAGAKVSAVTGMAFSVFLAAQTAQYLLRYGMFGSDDVKDELKRWRDDPWEAVATIASRSGVTGMLDPLVNVVTGVKYNRSVSDVALGAYFGFAAQSLDKLIGSEFRNSPNTNTAEHNQVEAIWNLAVAPTIAHEVLKRAPFLAPALAWTSSAQTRHAVADALVGPKGSKSKTGKKSSAKSEKTTDNRHARRHNGGTGSRRGTGGWDQNGNTSKGW